MTEKKPSVIQTIYRWVVEIVNALGCGITMFLMIFIMCDVCGRLFFNHPITGTTELAISLITIICFFQAVYVQYCDAHLNVTMLADKMPAKVNLIVKELGYILSLVIFFLFAKSSYAGLMTSIATHETEGEGALVLPMWPVRLCIVISSALLCLVVIKQIVEEIIKLVNMNKAKKGGEA